MMSTDLQTAFVLQFWKQWQDSTILLTSNRPQQQSQDKERRKGKRKTKGKDKQGKTINKWVGLQEATHLQDPKQNHSENAKSRNSKQEFFFKKQPYSSLYKNFQRGSLLPSERQ